MAYAISVPHISGYYFICECIFLLFLGKANNAILQAGTRLDMIASAQDAVPEHVVGQASFLVAVPSGFIRNFHAHFV